MGTIMISSLSTTFLSFPTTIIHFIVVKIKYFINFREKLKDKIKLSDLLNLIKLRDLCINEMC